MAQQTPKMKRLIKNYRGYTFESSCFTTKEYKSFQTKYINVLKDMATNLNAVLTVNKNHFCFSAFFEQKETGEVVYMSVSDVRSFQDEWLTNACIGRQKILRITEEDKTTGPTWNTLKAQSHR